MKSICIVGAGAIGGLLGTRLGQTGQVEMFALARGETLAALRANGLRAELSGDLLSAPVTASDRAADLGLQDVVILTVKGQAMPELAPQLAPLIGPQTVILSAMNGIPWWFCDGVPALANLVMESVDPGGAIAAALPAGQVIGSVLHMSVSSAAPGLSRHTQGQQIQLGELDGQATDRLAWLAELFTQAGFEASTSNEIRRRIWYKLWGNLTINPVSALTGSTSDKIIDDELVRNFCSAMMLEAAEIGRAIGCVIEEAPEDRHQVTRKLGAFKTSMLQDVEAGRSLELDNIVTAVVDIGRHLQIETPHIDALLGLMRLFARNRGLY